MDVQSTLVEMDGLNTGRLEQQEIVHQVAVVDAARRFGGIVGLNICIAFV